MSRKSEEKTISRKLAKAVAGRIIVTACVNFIDSHITLYYDASITYFYFPKTKKCYVIKSGIGRLFEEIFEEGKRIKGNQIKEILGLI